MKIILILIAVIGLTACAKVNYTWRQTRAGAANWDTANYPCMQEAQQRRSRQHANGYAYNAVSQIETNYDLYFACMRSAGWVSEVQQ